MDGFVGEIRVFTYDYEPMGWLFCNGQQVNVQQYQALYQVIGNTYGGNNKVFNVPDLSQTVPVGMGTGPGLSPWSLGQTRGAAGVALSIDTMPGHTHTAYAEQEAATTSNPAGMIVAAVKGGTPGNPKFYKEAAANLASLSPLTVQISGGDGQSHENRQPFQALNFCICWDGTYPARP